ncbi:response regulator transcription factor [Flavimaricola marinus]|uniref:Phosphate regulon transcriptional regulatory protein PhoB n=1 Tax=Flavimaricola marinus TaxID=1819565 RepID=A0A238L8W6_9RHOB|nr:response regulator transcription factor [Flavimaricola marinus]SMY06147.1 Phosphate regulon transcriptional regulatory protein PhoB [Flavimaricola marinus]
MTTRILIVDDDPQIRDVLRIALGQAGYDVVEAADGAAGLAAALEGPDLVVLDIGLPEMDGREVCRQLRKTSEVPVLFLTAEGDEIDRVVGLELGADDYVTKPFSPRELVARCRAILKRAAPVAAEAEGVAHGVLALDRGRHEARVGPVSVPLTAREMEILERLIARPDQVIPRPTLVDLVYGTNVHVSDRTVDSHLRNLRAKLAGAGCPDAIETVHGVGVRMGPCRGA